MDANSMTGSPKFTLFKTSNNDKGKKEAFIQTFGEVFTFFYFFLFFVIFSFHF